MYVALVSHQDCIKRKTDSKDENAFSCWQDEATLKDGTPLHMCSNGELKTLSNSKKKDKFDVWLGLGREHHGNGTGDENIWTLIHIAISGVNP